MCKMHMMCNVQYVHDVQCAICFLRRRSIRKRTESLVDCETEPCRDSCVSGDITSVSGRYQIVACWTPLNVAGLSIRLAPHRILLLPCQNDDRCRAQFPLQRRAAASMSALVGSALPLIIRGIASLIPLLPSSFGEPSFAYLPFPLRQFTLATHEVHPRR